MSKCIICKWFKEHNRTSEKDFFDTKCRELSLRKLETVLIGLTQGNLEAKKDSIAKHKKLCLGIKEGNLKRTLKKILLIKTEPSIPKECPHIVTRRQFNIWNEEIDEFCQACGKHLGSYSLEREELEAKRNRSKNLRILASLRRKRV